MVVTGDFHGKAVLFTVVGPSTLRPGPIHGEFTPTALGVGQRATRAAPNAQLLNLPARLGKNIDATVFVSGVGGAVARHAGSARRRRRS